MIRDEGLPRRHEKLTDRAGRVARQRADLVQHRGQCLAGTVPSMQIMSGARRPMAERSFAARPRSWPAPLVGASTLRPARLWTWPAMG